VPFLPLDPGSGMGNNQDPDPRSCLRELRIFGLKILKFFDVDPESCDPGAGTRDGKISDLG
jgi:hypothetical protein